MFTTTKISRGTQVGWQICIEDLSGFPFNWKNEHLSSEEKFKFNRTTIMKERKSQSRCMCINVFTLYIMLHCRHECEKKNEWCCFRVSWLLTSFLPLRILCLCPLIISISVQSFSRIECSKILLNCSYAANSERQEDTSMSKKRS